MAETTEDVFVSTPEQIAAAKVSQELCEFKIRYQEQTAKLQSQEKEINDLKYSLREANRKNDRLTYETGTLDEIIDKLIDKLAKG